MPQRQLTFDAPLTPADLPRLDIQRGCVKHCLSDHRWWTLVELQRALAGHGVPATSQGISARIRDMRKAAYGGHTVERRRREGTDAVIFEYKLL